MNWLSMIKYSDNATTAQAVMDHIHALIPPVRHLSLRHDAYLPKGFAPVWLVPVTQWPAYNHGKLIFQKAPEAPETMLCGLHLERGFGRQLATMIAPHLLMGSDWYWRRFISDMLTPTFNDVLRDIQQCSQSPLSVQLTLQHFNTAQDMQVGRRIVHDRLRFLLRDERLLLEPEVEAVAELSVLQSATTVQDLVMRIEATPDLAWHWINLVIGVQVGYGGSGEDVWSAGDLWEHALAPWLPYTR